MTDKMQRVEKIKACLNEHFKPSELDVIDEGHLHVGHAGAKTGLGHFAISIKAEAFANKNPLQKHRMIYDALEDLMLTDIHALRIISISA